MKYNKALVVIAAGVFLLNCSPINQGMSEHAISSYNKSSPLIDEPTAHREEPRRLTADETIPIKSGKLPFAEDIAKVMPKSKPQNPHIPLGLQAQFKIEYKGAFRINKGSSASSSSYAVGTLGFNPSNNSLFMAGHSHHNAIAEFKIPSTLSFEESAKNVVKAKMIQEYVRILEDTKNNKITGMLAYKNKLLVTSEVWYDGGGKNKDNLQVLNISDISEKPKGMLQLDGGARIAGYMSLIPQNMQSALGGEYLVGWASNYSITSRYSQGPSLAIFKPQDAIDNTLTVPTDVKQIYLHKRGKELVDGGSKYKKDISPVWNPLSKAKYGFIIPNTSIFMAIGKNGGINSGIGYKITQDNGNKCGGQCTYEAGDSYNYFWLYDVNDIVASENPWDARPFSYGKWEMPYKGLIIGATFDEINNTLYMSLYGAARVGKYDRPPMIVAYKITPK